MAVCAFWSVAIAMNLWEQGNRAAHRQLLLWAVTATLLYAGHFVFFNRITSEISASDTIYVVCNLLVYPLYLYYITMLTKGTVSRRQWWLTILPPVIIGIIVAVVRLSRLAEMTNVAKVMVQSRRFGLRVGASAATTD